jgi:glycosyltransferase involved in cell wall biosynthesis
MRGDQGTPLAVGFDITPLLGTRPSGVAMFVRQVVQELSEITVIKGYSLTYSQRSKWPEDLPQAVDRPAQWRRMFPAKLAVRLWQKSSLPPGRLWTGAVSAVHGTNYVLPPTGSDCTGVVTVHDLTHLHCPGPGSHRTLSLLGRSADKGARFHVPTNAVKTDLIEVLGLEESRIRVIQHGIPPVTKPSVEEENAAKSLTFGRPHILAVGDIIPRKEFPLLIEAFDEVAESNDEIQLVIAGSLRDRIEKDKVLRSKAQARHGERITVTDWIPEGVKTSLLRSAELLVYPSSYEGFGLPILEAQNAGVPVVASSVPAIVEVAGHGARLFKAQDREDLRQAIEETLLNSTLRAYLRALGTANCSTFSWRDAAEKLYALYQEEPS